MGVVPERGVWGDTATDKLKLGAQRLGEQLNPAAPVTPKITPWGEDIRMAGSATERILSPVGRQSKTTRNPQALALDEALKRYNDHAAPGEQTSIDPLDKDITARSVFRLNPSRSTMSNEEFTQYQRNAGTLARELASTVIPADKPDYVPTVEDIKLIQKLVDTARTATMNEMFGERKAQMRVKE